MGRLFWKIFLWFWLAMILVTLGVAAGVAQFMEERGHPIRRELARHQAETALLRVTDILELSGLEAAQRLQRRIGRRSPLKISIVPDAEVTQPSAPSIATSAGVPQSRQATGPDGRRYRIVVRLKNATRGPPHPPAGLFGLLNPRLLARAPELFFLRIGLAVLLSGLVCFWLAWYLTRPIGRLREATHRLAAGDLSARVGRKLGRRRDEIADLGRGFDHMAQQLQSLVSAQQRLLHDVSHELRSPLARLQVAVGLARRDSADSTTPALERIERESGRLDELVGQLLTLSRLEAGVRDRRDDYVELSALLREIATDADFEAEAGSRRVVLTSAVPATVRADMELLRRAFENVVRNGVKYTAPGSTVEIAMDWAAANHGRVHISVCDRGPGVAEEFLGRLFEPFARGETSSADGRSGYGLGLAIARRAVEVHEGSISARNHREGGLCIDIRLPIQA